MAFEATTKNLRSKKEIQRSYNEGSLTYDRLRFGSEGGRYLDEVEKEIVSQFLKGVSVLELGTGTARYGVFLGGKGYKFTGIDITRGMLKIAKEKCLYAGLDSSLIEMDAENLSFRDNQFDSAICIHTFQYFKNPSKALKEVYRVLKPGGRCLVSFESNNLVEGKFRTYFRRPRQHFYTTREVKGLFEKAGITPIYARRVFLFPLGLYRRSPFFVVRILKIFDDKLNVGSLSLVAGEKPIH